jgi:hypothetical protein
MSTTVTSGSTLTFERFWRWLQAHRNCILRAGGAEGFLYDQEQFHWTLDEDADRNAVVGLHLGKSLVAELILEVRSVQFVQCLPEEGAEGTFLFELVGGESGEAYGLFHFVVAHGFEDDEGSSHRSTLKH